MYPLHRVDPALSCVLVPYRRANERKDGIKGKRSAQNSTIYSYGRLSGDAHTSYWGLKSSGTRTRRNANHTRCLWTRKLELHLIIQSIQMFRNNFGLISRRVATTDYIHTSVLLRIYYVQTHFCEVLCVFGSSLKALVEGPKRGLKKRKYTGRGDQRRLILTQGSEWMCLFRRRGPETVDYR